MGLNIKVFMLCFLIGTPNSVMYYSQARLGFSPLLPSNSNMKQHEAFSHLTIKSKYDNDTVTFLVE